MNFINRYHPLNEALRHFDQLFDFSYSTRSGQSHAGAPAADFYADGDNYLIQLELPGVKKDDVKLAFEKDVLSLSAKRSTGEGDEQHVSRYHRSIRVPEQIDGGNISASFADGILTVTLPKAEQAKARQINIS
ncbi:MAG: Hsp20/alpha crystallin family protein [Verrucomicrobiota bacterium]